MSRASETHSMSIDGKWDALKERGYSVVSTTTYVKSGARKVFTITAPDDKHVGRIITDQTPDLENIKEATVLKIDTWEAGK